MVEAGRASVSAAAAGAVRARRAAVIIAASAAAPVAATATLVTQLLLATPFCSPVAEPNLFSDDLDSVTMRRHCIDREAQNKKEQ